MAMIAFSTSFSGTAVRSRHVDTLATPRCTMASSVAPAIKIKDTKSAQTSSVSLQMLPVALDEAAAAGVLANAALMATMRGRKMPPVLPSAPSTCPPGTAPADFYYPSATRNQAPVITLGEDGSLAVAYEAIEAKVGGESSNSPDSLAFWKEKTYKWVQPDAVAPAAPESEPEVISTALFEKYFPTVVRNRAPIIKMKPPAGPWDTTAYVTLASEYISLNEDLAHRLSVQRPVGEASIKASVTVEKYFGGPDANKAPKIEVVPDTSVTFGFEVVPSPLEQAKAFLAEKGVTPSE